MGIVMTVAMLLGLIVLRPTPWSNDVKGQQDLRLVTFTAAVLVLSGVWNVVWYGLRHVPEFWGWAAIVSGVSMLLAALIIFRERSNPLSGTESWLGAIKGFVVLVLAVCFMLYAVTIVQINLGLPILR